MTATRITEKGQTTIPKPLREKYGLEPGDEVVWRDTDAGIVLEKRTSSEARGLLVPDETPEETRADIAAELADRVRERRDRNYEES
ncbi:MAG: AbrB/MazE/SpoVT family DNA-binding domain-containing protein [Natrialbaceae archaeon]|nr:AbrB/MazE/SpoVT family DNA-binding domain-containing protein [Natrialbaceae archaeon]